MRRKSLSAVSIVREYDENCEAIVEADNFRAAKERTKHALETYELCRSTIIVEQLSNEAKLLLSYMMSEQLDIIKAAQEEYGPHLVWAHQRPASHFQESEMRIEEYEAKIRQMNVELGWLRRQGKVGNLT